MNTTAAEGNCYKDTHSCAAGSSPASPPPPSAKAQQVCVTDTQAAETLVSYKQSCIDKYSRSAGTGKRYNVREVDARARMMYQRHRNEKRDRKKGPPSYKRGPYMCNKCGQPSRGHLCTVVPIEYTAIEKPKPWRLSKYNCAVCGENKGTHMCVAMKHAPVEDVLTDNIPHTRERKRKNEQRQNPTRKFTRKKQGRKKVEAKQEFPRPVWPDPPPDPPEPPPAPPVNNDLDDIFSRLLAQADTFRSQTEDATGDYDIGSYFPDAADDWVRHLENVVLLGYQIQRSRDMTDIVLALTGYMKLYCSSSLIGSALKAIAELTDDPEEENSPQSFEFDSCPRIQDWNLFKNHFIFKKFSYLLSAAMMMGICETRSIEWSPFGLEVLNIKAAEQQIKAVDFFDAIMKTMIWCAETGSEVIREKSLRPLLYTDQRMRKLGAICDEITAKAPIMIMGNGGPTQEFEKNVDDCLQLLKDIAKAHTTGPSVPWIQKKYEDIVMIKQKLVAKNKNATMRQAPFGIGLTGPSGVGKSTLTKIAMKVAITAQEIKFDPNRIITKDFFDKYDSTYTSDILGVIFDDIGNGKSNFAVQSPTDVVIKFFNNVAAPAVKADLYDKAQVFLDFKVGVMTSNFRDYTVAQYSNKPESILRRFVHTRVQVKSKYRLPGSTALNTYHPDIAASNNPIFDVWELDLEEVFMYETKAGEESYRFQGMWVDTLQGKRVRCQRIDLQQYMEVIAALSHRHGVAQRNIVKKSVEMDNMAMCALCYLPCRNCCCSSPLKGGTCNDSSEMLPHSKELVKKTVFCSDDELYEHLVALNDLCDNMPHAISIPMEMAGLNMPHMNITEMVQDAAVEAVTNHITSFVAPLKMWNWMFGCKPIAKLTTKAMVKEFENIADATIPYAVAVVPEFMYESEYFRRVMDYGCVARQLHEVKKRIWWSYLIFGIVLVALLWLWWLWWAFLCFLVGLWWVNRLWKSHLKRKEEVREACNDARDLVPVTLKMIRDSNYLKHGIYITAFVLGIRSFRMWYVGTVKPQGGCESKEKPPKSSLDPKSIEKIPSWYDSLVPKFKPFSVLTATKSFSRTTEQMLSALDRNNLFEATVERIHQVYATTNVFFPRKSVVWLPLHSFYENADMTKRPNESISVEVMRSDKPGGKFTFKVSLAQVARLPHLDMVAAYVPNCPDFKTRYDWLPRSLPKIGDKVPAVLAVKKLHELKKDALNVEIAEVKHKYLTMRGAKYVSHLSVSGSCMGALVTDCYEPSIIGFHIGGKDSNGDGVSQTVTYDDAMAMERQLTEQRGIVLSAHAGEIPKQQMGVTLLKSDEIHPHSKFASLGNEAYVDVLGSTKLRTTQRSKVQPSYLTDHVTEVTGVANKWGPPKMAPNWKSFNATLEHVVHPTDMIDPDLLEFARRDYADPLLYKMDEWKLIEDFRPLEGFKECILGIPGKRFLDPVDPNTSVGAPLFGPKSELLTDVFNDKGVLVDRIPDALVVAEWDRQTQCIEKNERFYPLTAACLKDESTPLWKKVQTPSGPEYVVNEKVRVFQIVSFVFGLRIRKYFLPIARFLAMYPLVSESAVGINCFSPQWKEMMDHAKKYSHDNKVIGWDYSKYDVRMNSQMTRAVLVTFIELAERGGYPPEAIKEMKAMIVDLVHPLIDWNGTLIMAYNMNTSGNNITVQKNGSAGSIYVRCGYYFQFSRPQDAPKFVDVVAGITYGDDFLGSVARIHEDCFNYGKYKTFLAQHGMVITPPDKGGKEKDFLDADEADFLKRKSVYIPEIGTEIGALDEDSIFKSLHSNVRSATETPRNVARSCVEGAMHEWFGHGRDVYEKRQEQMVEICRRAELPVDAVHVTFDERVTKWKEKYLTG